MIHVGIDSKTGERRLREISEVTGRLEGDVIEMHQIYQIDENPEHLTDENRDQHPDSHFDRNRRTGQ